MGKKRSIRVNSRIEGYFRWPLFYLIIIAALTIIGALYNPTLGFIYIMFLAISTAIAIYLIFFNRRRLMTDIISFAMNLDEVQKQLLTNFEMPYILMDGVGRIKWYNESFRLLFSNARLQNMKITNIITSINTSQFPTEGAEYEKQFIVEDKAFKIVVRQMVVDKTDPNTKEKASKGTEALFVAYFYDISRENALVIKNEEQKSIFCLLYIDNYDEVIHSIEEVRRPLLIALIDRNINKFSQEIDGVIRKFEKDKYIIVFQNKYLPSIQENKFTILDSIREINIGNEMAVTLSLGIGKSEGSFTKKIDFAKVAMDLALGRGGDQAVIKNDEKLSFYGGKTRGVEKSTRVKARIKAHAFRELLDECDRVLIMGHKIGDMDSLGASIGVYACAKHFGKPAHIVINKITTSIYPMYEKLIEDKEYPTDLFVNNTQAVSFVGDQTLLVVVDVNRPSYTEYPDLLKYSKKIVVFDHHRVTAEYIENAVLSYVEPYASSTCEMITEITQYVSERVKLKPVEADALFAGIAVDTKNFVAKTGVKTFEAAAHLRRSGADAIRVSKLFKNDMASYKAKATAVKNSELFRESIAISICPSDIVNPSLVGAQAADELLNISGIKASFVLTLVENTIYISARSVDEINVQLIMEKLGGGGHLNVAGAQLENYTVNSALEILKQTIDEYFVKGD
ncbi:MAG: DHH family phosphoesterase [Firmicutes bacterium HGW-Firmicutes-1]|jgi:c-di-AMP phosphodiesterase-like protein|nr:MAG: DHH family phosphoesterase [Firmicutes bacterium HGW-Firmicutes-1]